MRSDPTPTIVERVVSLHQRANKNNRFKEGSNVSSWHEAAVRKCPLLRPLVGLADIDQRLPTVVDYQPFSFRYQRGNSRACRAARPRGGYSRGRAPGRGRAGRARRAMIAAHAPQFWQRRTNVWREVTSPARGPKLPRSADREIDEIIETCSQ